MDIPPKDIIIDASATVSGFVPHEATAKQPRVLSISPCTSPEAVSGVIPNGFSIAENSHARGERIFRFISISAATKKTAIKPPTISIDTTEE